MSLLKCVKKFIPNGKNLKIDCIRIFSKKVEYVLEDCNEVLIKINKFVVNKEGIVRVETLRMPVTIPDRLELDVFELDELENVDRSDSRVMQLNKWELDRFQIRGEFCACTRLIY